jgi:uncharacterized heparinase superfamily protein
MRAHTPRRTLHGAFLAGLSKRENVNLAVLALERARRGAIARLRRSRLLRWRHRTPAAQDLLLAPPDLRAPDQGFADELAAGGLGLAGAVAQLHGRSPFAVAPPSRAWLRELHSFSWLRHLDAARSPDTERTARALVGEWIRCSGKRSLRHAWQPELVARRVLSWLSHAGLLLDGAARRPYAALMRSLASQITYLTASWHNAPDGYPRLLALIALVQAELCLAANERRFARWREALLAELQRQILGDGGHRSRDPSVLVELLLDLLPLRQCLAAQGEKPPPPLLAAIDRMTRMLGHLRLGDGMLARFNAAATAERDALATVLAYAGDPASDPPSGASGYVRLERGSTVIVVDAGPPPRLEFAGAACAGCLAFELSSGGALLLVNAGVPRADAEGMRAIARATASHNTLCLGEQSSSKLIRNARLERALGGAPLRHPDYVTARVRTGEECIELAASHDGYLQRFGLVHTRVLALAHDGGTLTGQDRLAGARETQRFAWDVPFAIHFHLHPDAEAHADQSLYAAELLTGNGEHWRLTCEGAQVAIEQSVYFADPGGPRTRQQVVLRGVCGGASEVSWSLARMAEGALMLPARGASTAGRLGPRLSALPLPGSSGEGREGGRARPARRPFPC